MESVETGEISRRSFGWEQFLSIADDWETVQIAHSGTVSFGIDRPIRVESKGFVTAGGQSQKSQQTQRHSVENIEKW